MQPVKASRGKSSWPRGLAKAGKLGDGIEGSRVLVGGDLIRCQRVGRNSEVGRI